MSKDELEAGNPDLWETTDLKLTPPTSVMLSVRMPATLVIDLESYASDRSMTVSDAIRLAVERILTGVVPAPTYALVGTTESSSLRLAGPTVMVYAVSSGSRPEWVKAPTGGGIVTGNPAQ
jgi:hypothetical protein